MKKLIALIALCVALPAPTPAGTEPVAIPTAHVDRVRDRLNESIARANRSVGDADAGR